MAPTDLCYFKGLTEQLFLAGTSLHACSHRHVSALAQQWSASSLFLPVLQPRRLILLSFKEVGLSKSYVL